MRARVRQALASGNVSTEAIARSLSMSGRSLQRKLEEHGATFQDVLDEVRRAEAQRYLADPRLGLSEIAFRLGYSDVRSFGRAYKRWTGTPPRQLDG